MRRSDDEFGCHHVRKDAAILCRQWLSARQSKDNGYLHDGRADKNPYPHDRRADKDSYPHDSNNQCNPKYSYPSR